MLNLNQLRAFYDVAKTQSVRQALTKLFVSQPAVSNQIKAFEEFCGLSLFKRQNRRIVITDIGRILLNHCHTLFDFEKVIEKDIQGFHNLQIGVLKVGTVKAIAQYILARYLDRFHSLYPSITFALDEGCSREIGMSLLRFKNEITVIGEMSDLNGVRFIPLCTEKIVLFAAPGHPVIPRGRGRIPGNLLDHAAIGIKPGVGGVQREAFLQPLFGLRVGLGCDRIPCKPQKRPAAPLA